MVLSAAARETMWLKQFGEAPNTTNICDNKSAINHFRHHYIRQKVKDHTNKIEYLATDD